MSDWRLRPLTESMLRYAQRDTHYLLYLHGLLRKKLWERDGKDALLRVRERHIYFHLLLLFILTYLFSSSQSISMFVVH